MCLGWQNELSGKLYMRKTFLIQGNKSPVSIHKNKKQMFCPAHVQVASCLAVSEVLKPPRGVDDTLVRSCIRLIWELDSGSGIV